MCTHKMNSNCGLEKYMNNELHFLTHDNNIDCVPIRRSKTQNTSAEELFEKMQYLGRLYDHDPDNINMIQSLHKILLANNRDYNVDSMMKSVCLTTKYHSISTYYCTPLSRICLLIFMFPLLIVLGFFRISKMFYTLKIPTF